MNLRVFLRPQRLQRREFINQQCRQISLLFAAKATTTLGGQEVASFTPYAFPKTQKFKVNIWRQGKTVKHRGKWNVREALLELHEPGTLLRPLNLKDDSKSSRPTKPWIEIPADFVPTNPAHALGDDPNYIFKKMRINKVKIAWSKLGGAAKNVHFTEVSANTSYFEHMIGKVSWFLQNDRNVEISIHAKSAESLEELIHSCPHLHPEAILRAMPENCAIIIEPQINISRHIISWAMGPPDVVESKNIPKSKTPDKKTQRSKTPDTTEPKEIRRPKSLMPNLIEFKMRVLDDIDSGKIPMPKPERRYYQRMAKLAQLEQEEYEVKNKLEDESKDDESKHDEDAFDEHTNSRHTDVEHIDDGHIHDVEVRDNITNPTSKTLFTPITSEKDGSKSKM